MNYRSYLSRSSTGSFHFRLRLPTHVADSFGVREVRRSLATKDELEARSRALEAIPGTARVSRGT